MAVITGKLGQLQLLLVISALCGTFAAYNEVYPFRNVSLPWKNRVDDLVDRLSVPELIQLLWVSGPPGPITRLGLNPWQPDVECLHGDFDKNATSFPQAIGLAATFR